MTRTTTIALAMALALAAGTATSAGAAEAELAADVPPWTNGYAASTGTDDDDTFTITDVYTWTFSGPALVAGVVRTTAGGSPAQQVSALSSGAGLAGGDGDDTFAVAPSHQPIGSLTFSGEGGDDTIDTGNLQKSTLRGGPGANTLLGGPGDDEIYSTSNQDTIDGRGGYDRIYDQDSPQAGGRTVTDEEGQDEYRLSLGGDVGTLRIRPDGAGFRFTTSGNRPGSGTLTGLDHWLLWKTETNGPTDITLVDAVLFPDTRLILRGTPGAHDLADITVPTGAWIRSDETGSTYVISEYPQVDLDSFDKVSVHGPWTDADEGFVHRSVRDLLFLFLDDAGRAAKTAALHDGTLTRAAFVDEMMGLDLYRGYDVDRTFLKFLRRGADPSGKAYWINAIENGRPLWRFRAQLFGSNEYFTKAGGTNASYVTKAYTDVLGRAPDPSGQAYWTAKLDAGAGRGTVALEFLNAAETRRRLVDDQYRRFLDRLPTKAEQSAGVALVLKPSGEQQLVRALVLSAAYATRS